MLYRVAVETGLRANELRSLTRSSFALDDDQPTVTVEAGYSKRRREDTLPLRPGLAGELRAFLRTLAPAATVFKMPKRDEVIDMLRADLEAAGIVYQDDSGRFADFHSFRHSFISSLAAGGVHPKTAQILARHSTITLTMDRYTHVYRGELAEALNVLPDLSPSTLQTLLATGTDDVQARQDGHSVLASCLSFSGGFSSSSVDSGRLSDEKDNLTQALENTGETANLPGKNAMKAEGLEPSTYGLKVRCSTD